MIKSRTDHFKQWRLLYVQTTRQSINENPFDFLKMQPVKLITFDVTRTLLSFRTPVIEKYLEISWKFGIKADSEILEKNFREAWRTLNEKHPNFGKKSGLDWQNWWAFVIQKTFTGYIEPGDNKLSEIVQELIAFYATKEAFTKCPGAEDLLSYLKTNSIQMGIISNYDPRLIKILKFMELHKYFSFVLVSYDFGYSKPDVRIFKEALKLGNCALGNEAIHVGNDSKLDYLGAKEAGLKAFLISSNKKDLENSEVRSDEVFEDLFELKTYFQGKFN